MIKNKFVRNIIAIVLLNIGIGSLILVTKIPFSIESFLIIVYSVVIIAMSGSGIASGE